VGRDKADPHRYARRRQGASVTATADNQPLAGGDCVEITTSPHRLLAAASA